MTYTVQVGLDEATHLYHVLASDIPGLNVEAGTFEEFVSIVEAVSPDLLGSEAAHAKLVFQREIELIAP